MKQEYYICDETNGEKFFENKILKKENTETDFNQWRTNIIENKEFKQCNINICEKLKTNHKQDKFIKELPDNYIFKTSEINGYYFLFFINISYLSPYLKYLIEIKKFDIKKLKEELNKGNEEKKNILKLKYKQIEKIMKY